MCIAPAVGELPSIAPSSLQIFALATESSRFSNKMNVGRMCLYIENVSSESVRFRKPDLPWVIVGIPRLFRPGARGPSTKTRRSQ